jgi:hypothetical protein
MMLAHLQLTSLPITRVIIGQVLPGVNWELCFNRFTPGLIFELLLNPFTYPNLCLIGQGRKRQLPQFPQA